ncbi:hypothetical protein BKA81DRAFT_179379 [Phyllosticta paracitricarpa]
MARVEDFVIRKAKEGCGDFTLRSRNGDRANAWMSKHVEAHVRIFYDSHVSSWGKSAGCTKPVSKSNTTQGGTDSPMREKERRARLKSSTPDMLPMKEASIQRRGIVIQFTPADSHDSRPKYRVTGMMRAEKVADWALNCKQGPPKRRWRFP